MKKREKTSQKLTRLLRHDPLPWLLSTDNPAVAAMVRRDLLGQRVDVRPLWELPEAQRLLRKQQDDGRWCYPQKKPAPFNYDLYETFNTLGALVVAGCGDDQSEPVLADGLNLDAGSDLAAAPDQAAPDQASSPAVAAWAAIPAGSFQMGSPATENCRYSYGEDLHKVTLTRKFEMQTTEVTQGPFKTLMGYNPSYHLACGLNCPVENVLWHEAVAYCNALSSRKGLATCYVCTGTKKSTRCELSKAYGGAKIYETVPLAKPLAAKYPSGGVKRCRSTSSSVKCVVISSRSWSSGRPMLTIRSAQAARARRSTS